MTNSAASGDVVGRADLVDLADLADRIVPLNGAVNVRDVGGYPTPRGQIAWRRLYRAAGLDRLDDTDRSMLARLGVCTVIDLRRDDERRERPSALGDLAIRTIHVSITSGATTTNLTELPTLADMYRDMVDQAGPAIVTAITALAEPDALPAIVHCTAGKDRTGVVIALVLALAGVPDDLIVADYAASAGLLGETFADRLAGGDVDLARRLSALLDSPPELLELVLERMGASHGGVVQYLLDHGMDPAVPERLREALVDT